MLISVATYTAQHLLLCILYYVQLGIQRPISTTYLGILSFYYSRNLYCTCCHVQCTYCHVWEIVALTRMNIAKTHKQKHTYPAEIHTPNQLHYIVIVIIVADHQEHLFDSPYIPHGVEELA